MGCAWVAARLLDAGYRAEKEKTADLVPRWRQADELRSEKSAEYLVRSGQQDDLEFVLSHIDDLDTVPSLVSGELIAVSTEAARAAVRI